MVEEYDAKTNLLLSITNKYISVYVKHFSIEISSKMASKIK